MAEEEPSEREESELIERLLAGTTNAQLELLYGRVLKHFANERERRISAGGNVAAIEFVEELVSWCRREVPGTRGPGYALITYARRVLRERQAHDVFDMLRGHLDAGDQRLLDELLQEGDSSRNWNAVKNVGSRQAKRFKEQLSPEKKTRYDRWLLVLVPPVLVAAGATAASAAVENTLTASKDLQAPAATAASKKLIAGALAITGAVAAAIFVQQCSTDGNQAARAIANRPDAGELASNDKQTSGTRTGNSEYSTGLSGSTCGTEDAKCCPTEPRCDKELTCTSTGRCLRLVTSYRYLNRCSGRHWQSFDPCAPSEVIESFAVDKTRPPTMELFRRRAEDNPLDCLCEDRAARPPGCPDRDTCWQREESFTLLSGKPEKHPDFKALNHCQIGNVPSFSVERCPMDSLAKPWQLGLVRTTPDVDFAVPIYGCKLKRTITEADVERARARRPLPLQKPLRDGGPEPDMGPLLVPRLGSEVTWDGIATTDSGECPQGSAQLLGYAIRP